MKSGFFAQLSAFGVVLHLRGMDSDLAPAAKASLLPGWCLAQPDREPDALIEIERMKRSSGGEFVIKVDGETSEDRVNPAQLSRALDQTIHLKIAELSPEAVFLHAGVVAWEGEAIVIPGRSMSGKSTLTKELAAAGATFYSDEFAPLLPDGRVLPYPKPLSVRRRGMDPAQIEPSSMGWRENLPAVPVFAIAAVCYNPEEACAASVRQISKADAAVAVLNNAVPMVRAPQRCLEAVAVATNNALCLGGQRPEAVEFAAALLRGSFSKKRM
jgi:hypothetical protein